MRGLEAVEAVEMANIWLSALAASCSSVPAVLESDRLTSGGRRESQACFASLEFWKFASGHRFSRISMNSVGVLSPRVSWVMRCHLSASESVYFFSRVVLSFV